MCFHKPRVAREFGNTASLLVAIDKRREKANSRRSGFQNQPAITYKIASSSHDLPRICATKRVVKPRFTAIQSRQSRFSEVADTRGP